MRTHKTILIIVLNMVKYTNISLVLVDFVPKFKKVSILVISTLDQVKICFVSLGIMPINGKHQTVLLRKMMSKRTGWQSNDP